MSAKGSPSPTCTMIKSGALKRRGVHSITPGHQPAGSHSRSISLFRKGSWELPLQGPILAHELVRPSRLANLLPWKELDHHRFDVEHGRSVDCVEFGDNELGAFNSDHLTNGAPDSIGSILASLCEDADGRPLLVVSWVMCPRCDFRPFYPMKQEQNLDVGKVTNALKCLSGKLLSKGNARFLPPQKSSSA